MILIEPILAGSEERACSFFSEDAGMAEACLVSLVVPSVRSEIVRVDQTDETDQMDEIDQIDQIDQIDSMDSPILLFWNSEDSVVKAENSNYHA